MVSSQAALWNVISWLINYIISNDLILSKLLYKNRCGIQYTVCPDPVNNPGHGFTLTGVYTSTAAATASFTDSACATDYLLIPCASDVLGQFVNSDLSVCSMRMCGGVFSSINAKTRSIPVFSMFTFARLVSFHSNFLLTLLTRSIRFIDSVWIEISYQRTGSEWRRSR